MLGVVREVHEVLWVEHEVQGVQGVHQEEEEEVEG